MVVATRNAIFQDGRSVILVVVGGHFGEFCGGFIFLAQLYVLAMTLCLFPTYGTKCCCLCNGNKKWTIGFEMAQTEFSQLELRNAYNHKKKGSNGVTESFSEGPLKLKSMTLSVKLGERLAIEEFLHALKSGPGSVYIYFINLDLVLRLPIRLKLETGFGSSVQT